MKKFLALLGVVTLTTTAAASVVSCSARVNQIDTHLFQDFDAGNPDRNFFGNDYNKNQFANATVSALPISANNLAQLFNPVANQGNHTVHNDIYNVINYNHRKVVKPNGDQDQLRKYRGQLAGREAYTYNKNTPEKDRYMRASVDGVYMPKLESDQTTKDKYYQEFKTTSIGSIEGLYNLYNYEPGEGYSLSLELASLKDSLAETFGEGTVGRNFAELLIGLTKNPYGEAAYTDIYYNSTNSISDSFIDTPTKVTTFNQASSLSIEDKDVDYSAINTKADDHKDQETKRVNERSDVDPFNRLVLKSTSGPVAVAPTTLEDVTDKIAEKDRKNWNTAWSEYQKLIQLNSTDKVYLYNAGKDDKYDWKLVPNQYFYASTDGLKLKYDFAVNAKHHEQGDIYHINFTAKNLTSVWEPVIIPVQLKEKSDDQKKYNYSQVTWVFRGYKFSKGLVAYQGQTEDTTGLLGFKDSAVSEADNKKLDFELTHRFADLVFTDWKIDVEHH